jgi:hypothetical protein
MKKIIYILFGVLTSGGFLASCDPIDQSSPSQDVVTAADLDNTATVTQIGSSNAAVFKYTGKGTCQWTDGIMTYTSSNDTIFFFGKGAQEVTLTVSNQDGTTVSKTFDNVNVTTMTYTVDPTYGYLCGDSGSKTWVWDNTLSAVWGNGAYLENSAPSWYTVSATDIETQATTYSPTTSSAGDGTNAYMTFTLKGTKLTKSDGTSGKFKLNMTDITKSNWDVGTLTTTSVFVPMGILVNVSNTPVYSYKILSVTSSKLVLCTPETSSTADWGTAWFWMFKAKD